jgi:hypothetical protein
VLFLGASLLTGLVLALMLLSLYTHLTLPTKSLV